VERVTAILAETGFPAERLEIEVTESIIQSVDHSLRLFTRLKALGYRSPSTTSAPVSPPEPAQEPAHRSHQDRQGLRPGVARRQAQPRAVPYHSPAGQLLGMAVTAEGIETQPQRQFLQSLRCEEGQGYLFSHPLPEPQPASLLPSAIEPWPRHRKQRREPMAPFCFIIMASRPLSSSLSKV
jgi:predicted signal transduction protein with EAL and GGDEF domain